MAPDEWNRMLDLLKTVRATLSAAKSELASRETAAK